MKKTIQFILFILISTYSFSQKIGTWRLHFNYNVSQDITYSKTKILSATDNSLLFYDKEDNSLRELDKANGLSDIGISKIDYCKDENTFIVAYNSTNIDLISDNYEITNIPDVLNKITSISKSINNIYIYQSKAYISSDLGIIVLDINNQEIDNTYIIGNNGNPVSVLDCTIWNDTIFALTKTQGVKTAPLAGLNLLDYSNWSANNISMPTGNITNLEVFGDFLYVATENKLYRKKDNNWITIFYKNSSLITSLKTSEKLVCVIEDTLSNEDNYLIIDKEKTDTILNENALSPKMAIIDFQNDFYIADLGWGLIDYNKNKRLEPDGKPFSSDIFSFNSYGNKVFASAGGIVETVIAQYNVNGFYIFENNRWKNINKFNTNGLDNILNFLDVKENPTNGKIYGATTEGLVVYDNNSIEVFDSNNSIIEKQVSSGSNTYVTGIDFDSKGNTWIVNSHSNFPLKVLTKNGEWYKYPLVIGNGEKYTGIFIDSYDQVWVRSFNKGIALFPSIEDFSTTAITSIKINNSTANLPSKYANTIVEDKNGAIWVGTNSGIGVFDCPENIFDATTDCKTSRRIKSTLDEYTEYLFDTDAVQAIAVDGANRKWVGTDAGLWLISETGEDVLLNFNKDNSPMPSNEVKSIAIQEQTGEVFIATSLGMVSYTGDATEPASDISNIKAFPNPITPDYQGVISITGLVENTFIKITDINGTLIDDGYALGGKYTWNGNDYNGNRASSGVYLVFSSDNQSKNKAVAKIVFLN